MISGISFLDKPAGITSYDALASLKRTLGTRKIGHAGTLDKFASGLLIVLVGKCTKLNTLFVNLMKRYRAVFYMGIETDTLDPEGKTVAEAEVPPVEAIRAVIPRFIGALKQVPPKYSAVHVDGKRAYSLARAGKDFIPREREVFIDDFQVIDYTPPELEVRICCSKGTYIRSIARDVGLQAGSRAFVKELCREGIGEFDLTWAASPDTSGSNVELHDILTVLQQIPNIGFRMVRDECISKVLNGVPLTGRFLHEPVKNHGIYALKDTQNRLLAIAAYENGKFSYRFVGPCP